MPDAKTAEICAELRAKILAAKLEETGSHEEATRRLVEQGLDLHTASLYAAHHRAEFRDDVREEE